MGQSLQNETTKNKAQGRIGSWKPEEKRIQTTKKVMTDKMAVFLPSPWTEQR